MKLKEVFENAENGVLSYDEFVNAAKAGGANFVDIKEGGYVSSNKYQDELASKDKEIELLNSTISTRDTDLEGLKKQLEAAGVDAGKLEELTTSLKDLQTKYDGDTKAYKEQLRKQAYEFAIREHANELIFSSAAAKRDYINQAIAKDLKMDNNSILGISDFDTAYSADNKDAFMEEYEYDAGYDDSDYNNDSDYDDAELPHFVESTPGTSSAPDPTGGFHFNFTGVRPAPTE